MIKKMFTVYDAKAFSFCSPFVEVSTEVAIRAFAYAANDPAVDLSRFPEDFSLHEIGTFDTDSGAVEILTPWINHGLAVQFKEVRNAP